MLDLRLETRQSARQEQLTHVPFKAVEQVIAGEKAALERIGLAKKD